MKYIACIITAVLFLGTTGCDLQKEVVFSGNTMGTTYHVKVVTSVFRATGSLQAQIDERLAEINRSMSAYLPDSEISRFNSMGAGGEPLAVSEEFFNVMQTAALIHELTDGAWDGTVMPLVELWGFGPEGFTGEVPSRENILRCLETVGFSNIELNQGNRLAKPRNNIQLDLGAIAKGYGVDALATLLRRQRYQNYLVEVGGEVFAAGVRKDGNNWRVGINRPEKSAAFDDVYHVVTLSEKALATSGDYRNYFESNGNRYSHIIDPRTGYPVSNGVVSASVIADSCMMADGLATAMMVMGADNALALADRLSNVSCLLVIRETDGNLTDYMSKGFKLER